MTELQRTYREEFGLDSMEDMRPDPASINRGHFVNKKTEAFIEEELTNREHSNQNVTAVGELHSLE